MSSLLMAVDIGNSFVHLSHFSVGNLPSSRPSETRRLYGVNELDSLTNWLTPNGSSEPLHWTVSSVHRDREQQLSDWVRARRPGDSYRRLAHDDFGLEMCVRYPERVGKDRLAAAVAANVRRRTNCGAIVVDAGTAITVDYLDSGGCFHGGAILPGPRIAARALAQFTDALPLAELSDIVPAPVGRDTEAALQSGLYWGAVGAVRELVSQMTAQAGTSVELFLTGGGVETASFLSALDGQRIPHLTLDGIALTALRRLPGS